MLENMFLVRRSDSEVLYSHTGLCCQRSHWPPDDLCTVDRRCPVCDRLVFAQIHTCWCSIPKCGQGEKNKKLQQWPVFILTNTSRCGNISPRHQEYLISGRFWFLFGDISSHALSLLKYNRTKWQLAWCGQFHAGAIFFSYQSKTYCSTERRFYSGHELYSYDRTRC